MQEPPELDAVKIAPFDDTGQPMQFSNRTTLVFYALTIKTSPLQPPIIARFCRNRTSYSPLGKSLQKLKFWQKELPPARLDNHPSLDHLVDYGRHGLPGSPDHGSELFHG